MGEQRGDSRPLKVLVINQYFPPDTSATAVVFAGFVKALTKRGHEVTVLCGHPSYDPAPAIEDDPSSDATTEVDRIRSTSFDRRSMAGRISNYLSFLLSATVNTTLRSRQADVVLVGTDPPLAVVAALRAAGGAPVVYNIQDLHPESAIASGLLSPGRFARGWERVHRRALGKVDRVVCVGGDMAERVSSKGIPAERVFVVPNGAPEVTGEPHQEVVDELRGGRDFVVVHAGNIGAVGAWDAVLAAAARLNGDFSLVFVGDGVEAGRIRSAGGRVIDYRPAAQLPSVMEAGDLQLVTMRPGTEGSSVPSKLYTILAHGRPVLAVVPERCEVASVVRRFGCGYVVDPTDPDSIAAAIRHARSHPDELAAMASSATKAAIEYERGHCLERMVDLVEGAALERG